MPNKLHSERSPYLRQHSHNPVEWYPWGPEALQKAKTEDKLILVSIGYSACHWCHVMERESFEDPTIAAVMNEHYVSIKVDREERPDIDQIYMTAVQLMTDQGGWPLNCICLPDGRPIYGGTYFRPDDWKSVLLQVAKLWHDQPEIALDYAERLTKGIRQSEQLPVSRIPETYTLSDLERIITPWKRRFDKQYGGYTRAPKFPLPNNWLFLLRYAVLAGDDEVLEHVHFTLQQMASGGIYDHVGGGFARYAVDGRWHIPHFEKMLYDNAQLVSLYTEAWQQRPVERYRQVVFETLAWVKRELTAPDGGFYCALDADSEGKEGKYYTFDQAEFESVLGKDADLLIRYYHLTPEGNWQEERTNVLYTDLNDDMAIQEAGVTAEEWQAYLTAIKRRLRDYREHRVRPGLDDKQLTSWNALMLKAFVDAYRVFGHADYLNTAKANAAFIQQQLYGADGGLLHQPEAGGRIIPGFLDDYAHCIAAYLGLYEATFDEIWVTEAKRLADYALDHFYDPESLAFYYTSDTAEPLIARKQEIMDNVIPSSVSTMVHQLHRLSVLFDEPHYRRIAAQLLANVVPHMASYGSAYANWAIRLLEEVYGWAEVVLTGPGCAQLRQELDRHYHPNKIIIGGTNGHLPLLADKISRHETRAYVCRNNTCSLPVRQVEELLRLIN